MYEECCKILGVKADANFDDVKIAYRKKVKTVHPDVNFSPDAHRDFIILNKCFEYIKQIKQQEIILNKKMISYQEMVKKNNYCWDDFYNLKQKARYYQTVKYKKNIHFKSTLIGKSIFISSHVAFFFLSVFITFNPLISALKHGIDPNVSVVSAITSASFSFVFGIIMCISLVLSGINLKSGF